jgi:hypothetical protein
MSLRFSVEPLLPNVVDFMNLGFEHWKETEGYRHGQNFNPDTARYLQYNDIGFYVYFTARDEGRIVGHAGMYITPSMHTQRTIATEDVWFLLQEHRKGRNAIAFYKYVEEECRRRRVVEIGMTTKLTNGAGRILEYLGYTEVSKQYSKHLVPAADSGATTEHVEAPDVRAVSTATA